MFSGIVDHCGVIRHIEKKPQLITIQIETTFPNLVLGESISVDGICLTVAEYFDMGFICHLSPETIALTSAKHFQAMKKVNLERALAVGDRIGGHWVLGHVDQVIHVQKIEKIDECIMMQFGPFEKEQKVFLVKKGSVTVNGVSLTLNEVGENFFQVMLIPHTLQRTNLIDLNINDEVNIEFDYLAKLVAQQMRAYQ